MDHAAGFATSTCADHEPGIKGLRDLSVSWSRRRGRDHAQTACGDASGCAATSRGRMKVQGEIPVGPDVGPVGDRRGSNDASGGTRVPARVVVVWNGISSGRHRHRQAASPATRHVDVGLAGGGLPTIQGLRREAVIEQRCPGLRAVRGGMDEAFERPPTGTITRGCSRAPRLGGVSCTGAGRSSCARPKNVAQVVDKMMHACAARVQARHGARAWVLRDGKAGWVMGPTNEV